MNKHIFKLITIMVIFLMPYFALAYSPPIENGISWLTDYQSADGSWGSNSELAILDTATALDTLRYLNVNSPTYLNGVIWVSSKSLSPTDFLARKVISLYFAGGDVSADLLTLINGRRSDGGWGGDSESTSMINDTALALQALKAVNYSDLNLIGNAIGYITSAQNTDGGFGFYKGDDSNVYMTALVSYTLQQFPETLSIATAINKATTYLIAHQNTDGGFGEGGGTPPLQSASTVFETAYAYLALTNEITDATVLGNTINYLKTTQLPNGSWEDDPYSTALTKTSLYVEIRIDRISSRHISLIKICCLLGVINGLQR